ncbi:MAG: tetratricopeptide repeat protein, partial [Treponema sp.]|nr:tetratricopeptide repeat protein [Treponema sp.]
FEANNNLGTAYLRKEDYTNAILYYKNALKIDSKNNEVRSNLARAYAKNGDYDLAKVTYIDLLKADKEDWDAYIELAKVCIQLNQNNLAEGYLLTVKDKNPTYKADEINSLLQSISQ